MIRRLLPLLALAALVLRGALPAAAHVPAAAWHLAPVLCGAPPQSVTQESAPYDHGTEGCADHCLGALPALLPAGASGAVLHTAAAPATAVPARPSPLPARPLPYRVRAPPVPVA